MTIEVTGQKARLPDAGRAADDHEPGIASSRLATPPVERVERGSTPDVGVVVEGLHLDAASFVALVSVSPMHRDGTGWVQGPQVEPS
jgi:hypothetical protein